jgi:hypothetical protein
VREKVADPLAALAVLLEFPFGSDDAALVLLAAAAERFDGDGLAVEFVELRFVIEGIDVAGAAVHEKEDDALGLSGQRRRLGRERVGELVFRLGGRGAVEKTIPRQQPGERDAGEAGAGLPEELAAGAAAEGASGPRRIGLGTRQDRPPFMKDASASGAVALGPFHMLSLQAQRIGGRFGLLQPLEFIRQADARGRIILKLFAIIQAAAEMRDALQKHGLLLRVRRRHVIDLKHVRHNPVSTRK